MKSNINLRTHRNESSANITRSARSWTQLANYPMTAQKMGKHAKKCRHVCNLLCSPQTFHGSIFFAVLKGVVPGWVYHPSVDDAKVSASVTGESDFFSRCWAHLPRTNRIDPNTLISKRCRVTSGETSYRCNIVRYIATAVQ